MLMLDLQPVSTPTYLALRLGETLNLLIERIDRELLLLVVLLGASQRLLDLGHLLSLLGKLLRQLLVLLDLLREGDFDATLALFKFLDFGQSCAQRDSALLFESCCYWRHHAIQRSKNYESVIGHLNQLSVGTYLVSSGFDVWPKAL